MAFWLFEAALQTILFGLIIVPIQEHNSLKGIQITSYRVQDLRAMYELYIP